jgi:hypothetical protein
MGRQRGIPVVLVAAVVLLAGVGCSGDDGGGDDAGAVSEEPEGGPAPEDLIAAIETVPPECEPLDPRTCLLPFPSDRFTVEDPDTDTGRRVDLPESGMPVNVDGVVTDPTEWNRNDGFSPGTPLTTWVPDLDAEASGLPDITDVPASLGQDSPVVVVDTESGERHPVWAELDANVDSPEDRLLFIRPGVNYREGHRYVVALRDLTDTAGDPIEPSPAFEAYRDRLSTDLPQIEDRRDAMERVFDDLAAAGVARDDLYLAWDFTIASERNLSERLLHIRDDAFADLDDAAPAFEVTGVRQDPEPGILEIVDGTFTVPLYLEDDGAPGTRFTQGPDGLPERNGDFTAGFTCVVPDAALDEPAHLSLYGHGLLGSRDEVHAGNVHDFAREHDVVFCATDWVGMAEEDVGNAIAILQELGRFPTLADRVQQGILDFLFLGRLMIHEDGLVSDPAFQSGRRQQPLIDTSALAFDSNSQGAIIGGAATAVAQDWTRAVLGVPGMNYSLLLRRSSDFDTYAAILDPAYPDPVDQALGLGLIQMLWDRAETNGYAEHITDDPYPDTPPHEILLNVAFGDHQVSMWAGEIEARTIGASVRMPALDDGRHPDLEPYWGLPVIEAYPFDGSALFVWDDGAAVPPTTNTPPREGADPHESPRADPANRALKAAFLFDGEIVDVCDGPCHVDHVD